MSDDDKLDWWLTLLMLRKDIREETDPKMKQRWVNAYQWALERYIENNPGHRMQQSN